jgi:hypothetical protein
LNSHALERRRPQARFACQKTLAFERPTQTLRPSGKKVPQCRKPNGRIVQNSAISHWATHQRPFDQRTRRHFK